MIILLNGPPRSGKDFIAKALVRTSVTESGGHSASLRWVRYAFADQLKRMTHRLYDINDLGRADFFEDKKDESCPEFYGLTPRQAYIAVSEKLIKPTHGDGFFGEVLSKKIALGHPTAQVVVPDSGFPGEAETLALHSGREIYKVDIHRPGTDFSNDSRSYWDGPAIGIPTMDFVNDENFVDKSGNPDLKSLATKFETALNEFILDQRTNQPGHVPGSPAM